MKRNSTPIVSKFKKVSPTESPIQDAPAPQFLHSASADSEFLHSASADTDFPIQGASASHFLPSASADSGFDTPKPKAVRPPTFSQPFTSPATSPFTSRDDTVTFKPHHTSNINNDTTVVGSQPHKMSEIEDLKNLVQAQLDAQKDLLSRLDTLEREKAAANVTITQLDTALKDTQAKLDETKGELKLVQDATANVDTTQSSSDHKIDKLCQVVDQLLTTRSEPPHRANTRRGPNVVLPRFDGSLYSSFERWQTELETFFNYLDWPESDPQRHNILPTILDGFAKVKYFSLPPDTRNSYRNAMASLKDIFSMQQKPLSMRRNYINRRQKHHESVREFSADILQRFSECQPHLETQIDVFCNNLLPEIAAEIKDDDYNSINQLVACAEKAENRIRLRKEAAASINAMKGRDSRRSQSRGRSHDRRRYYRSQSRGRYNSQSRGRYDRRSQSRGNDRSQSRGDRSQSHFKRENTHDNRYRSNSKYRSQSRNRDERKSTDDKFYKNKPRQQNQVVEISDENNSLDRLN